MKLRDIVAGRDFPRIMYRTNAPEETDCAGDGILVGYCHYTDGGLYSDDGDVYTLDDEIERFEIDDWGLVVWVLSEWRQG